MILSQNNIDDTNITSVLRCITKKWPLSHAGIKSSPDGSIKLLEIFSLRVNCKKKIHPIMGLQKLRYNDKMNQSRRRK